MTATRLGDYEVIREIGKGGMGRVYLAKNIYLSSMIVVLKVLMDPAQKERFIREPEVLCKLDHKNICQIRTFFIHEGDLVIAMQYVEGKTLAERISDADPLDLREVKQIFLQVLDGVAYAHAKNVHHLDLKPNNIMIDNQNQVKIIDFGIARQTHDTRLTATGQVIGTPLYMAPEQFTALAIERLWLCDIYALGVSLYEVCCGKPPFESTNPYLLKEMHCRQKPPRPSTINSSISTELEEIILKAIAKKPGNRFQSAIEMSAALAAVRSPDLGMDKTIVVNPRPRTSSHFRIPLIAVFALTIVVLGIVFLRRWYVAKETHISFSIPAQRVSGRETFKQIDLKAVLPSGKVTSVTKWTTGGSIDLAVKIDADFVASVEKPSTFWKGKETVFFIATQRYGTTDSAAATFECTGQELKVTNPLPIQLTPSSDTSMDLSLYVVEPKHPDSTITWTFAKPPGLSVRISGHKALIRSQAQWRGPDSIVFTAKNQYGESSSMTAMFERARSMLDSPRIVTTTYHLRLSVIPSGCWIFDEAGNQFTDRIAARVETGVHYYKVYSRDFPIASVEIPVNTTDIDTVINLNTIARGERNTKLGIAIITNDDKIIERRILLNRFPTDNTSSGRMIPLLQGEYDVWFDAGTDLIHDSTKVNGKYWPKETHRISLRNGVSTVVRFYVTVTRSQ